MKPEHVFAFENAGWPALLIDRSGTILRSNQSAIETFGMEILGGAKLSLIWAAENPYSPEDFLLRWESQPAASNTLKFRARGETVSYTTVICGLQEQEHYFVLQLFPDLGSGLGDSESAAEGTHQKQKLDVAIKLARSVALDFKNALGGVLGHSSLLLMQAGEDHPWKKSLEQIEKAVARGADAAASLGSFGRQDREQQTSITGNLNSTLQKAVATLKAAAAQAGVEWELQLERKLFFTRFDEIRIQQAFVKILENAIEAMPRGGRIRISSKNLSLSQSTQDRTAKLPAGTYVCAEFADNGFGIEESALPRVFEPFFTTKSESKHRGLGLPWVYGIITNLGGGVAISSSPGFGTSVRLYLPAESHYAVETAEPDAELRGSGTVLLVDDEEVIVSMGAAVLSTYGYQVLTASSGKEALEILARLRSSVRLMICDLVMPGMSGTELVEQADKLVPGLPVIIMSGALTGNETSTDLYLAKPFTAQDLLRRVRLVLSRES